MTTNVTASIRTRLLNRAKAEQTDFQLFLDRYGCERFLYRLGKSEVRDQYVLKGASLLALWMDEPYRATRDVDFLAFGENDEATIRDVITTICNVSCPEDGIAFDISTLRVSAIREGNRYGGQRATLTAFLGTAKCNVQVDFGFGDVVIPAPEEARLPTLIDGIPVPFLRTYPQVSSIAEKFESMVQLGIGNSRMKDFCDVWALSETFAFDGPELQEAVARCFDRRGTELLAEMPQALTPAFYSNRQLQTTGQLMDIRAGCSIPRPAHSKSSATGYNPFWGLFTTASWRASRSRRTGLLEGPGNCRLHCQVNVQLQRHETRNQTPSYESRRITVSNQQKWDHQSYHEPQYRADRASWCDVVHVLSCCRRKDLASLSLQVQHSLMTEQRDVLYRRVLLYELSLLWQMASLGKAVLMVDDGKTDQGVSGLGPAESEEELGRFLSPLTEEARFRADMEPQLGRWCHDVSMVASNHTNEITIAKHLCQSYPAARSMASEEGKGGPAVAWLAPFLRDLRGVLASWHMATYKGDAPLLGPVAAAIVRSPLVNSYPLQLDIVPGTASGGVFQIQAYAAGDLDTLSIMHPRKGEQSDRLMYDNLAAIWPIFAALGAERLVVACALEDRSDLRYYREAAPGAKPVVCLPVAPIEMMQERVRSREIGMLQEQLLANSLRLAETLPHAQAEDFTVNNGDGRSITDVARGILSRAGWL